MYKNYDSKIKDFDDRKVADDDDNPKKKNCNRNVHGWVLDSIRKSDTMTWLVCYYCKLDGKIEPIAWQETTKEELMRVTEDEEELQKYV